MSSSVLEPRWPPRRWWFFIGLVFCAQAGLVFWLGETSLPQPRPPARTPLVRIAGSSSALVVALTDPTLFALPHRQAFAGEAWLEPPPPPAFSLDWSEKPLWLELPNEQLGQLFAHFAETNRFESRRSFKSDAALTLSRISVLPEPRQPSRVRLAGELTRRRLLSEIELPSWPHSDILTNTVVSVAVNSTGETLSADLVSGSGLASADQYALTQASGARFESIGQTGPGRTENVLQGLTWGDMIFEWRTLPLPMTNAP